MKFSVIVPTKDRENILNKTLACLNQVSNLNELEIIIINDSEKPLLIDNGIIATKYQVYKNPGKGVASARNFGATKAINDWLVFMDDDMLVQPDSFLKIIPLVELVKEGCLNLNWIYPVSVTKRRDHEPFVRYLNHYGFDSLEGWSRSSTDWDHQKIFKVNGITSQFLVVRKTVFNSVNGYNTSFPFAGYEDYDLSERIMQKGINIYIDPNNMIFHNEEDRLVVENWLQRKMRGAVTRKVAVSLGHQALTLHYPLLKKVFYRMVYSFRTPILYMLNHWPKSTKLDRFYFLLINVMLGSYSCEGYTKK